MDTVINRRTTLVAIAAAAGTIVRQEASAQSAPATPSPTLTTLPDTPAGQQLQWGIDVINGEVPQPDTEEIEQHFSETFLALLSAEKLQELFTQFSAQAAPISRIQITGIPVPLALNVIVNVKGNQSIAISITVEEAAPNKIVSLTFAPYSSAPPATPTLTGWSDLESVLSAAGSIYAIHAAEISSNGEATIIHETNPETVLAIGSDFKLYVLGALSTKIEAGELSWDQTLTVTDEVKSFPSGVTQNELSGTKISIDELSRRMISISDNTAADMLIDAVARESCETALATQGNSDPARTTPFLKTREMFTLKVSGDDARLQRYITAGTDVRRDILAQMEGEPLPSLSAAAAWTTPIDIDTVEWFATAADLGRAIDWLWDMGATCGLEPIRDILTINPGMPYDDKTWNRVAFKGGSEIGVLSLCWLLERNDGRRFLFSCGVNNPDKPISEETVVLAAAGAFPLLAAVK